MPFCATDTPTGEALTFSPDRSSTLPSHAIGVANRETTTPLASTNDTLPSFSARADKPFVFTSNDHDTSPPPAAATSASNAASSRITVSCSNPDRRDSTTTSTPGDTSVYVARVPSNTGAASLPGQPRTT